MKKLKKILLINWLYFSKELIEVGDINFLTGKNGAGKSTVIDALQIVLLGETNSRNFNQAANEKSQRTLEGYLRADMDDNSPYSRRGKDFSTYIVCEFQDEMEGSSFVTGVTFDCRSDGSYRDTFFIYTGTLPENCFIEQGEAMEISALRRFLKQNYARTEFYDTQKEYRRNMLAKWNVHNEQVLRMMKKAVSFRPIVDIQKFITENICDIPDKPNIELMQQNIRDYKRHELLAQRQQEKLDALQQISRLYQEMNQAIDRCQIQKFLVRWAEKEAAQTEIDQRELERTECKENLANVNEQREELERQIEQKETRRSELELACRQSNVFQEEERLLNMEKALRDEQKKLEQGLQNLEVEIKREARRLQRFCGEIQELEPEELLIPVQEAANTAQKAYVDEFEDRIVISNAGQFLPGNIKTVLEPAYAPPYYRNPLLAQAMVNFKMIDTASMGIRRVYSIQKEKLIPMPDYDLSRYDQVRVTVYGKVLNDNYTKILFENPNMDLDTVYLLDRVQKGENISRMEAAALRKLGLIEGKIPKLFVSATVAEALDQKAQYIKNKGFDDQYYKQLIVDYLNKWGKGQKSDFDKLLFDKLPDSLTAVQKNTKIRNLLASLRMGGIIETDSENHQRSNWVLTKK